MDKIIQQVKTSSSNSKTKQGMKNIVHNTLLDMLKGEKKALQSGGKYPPGKKDSNSLLMSARLGINLGNVFKRQTMQNPTSAAILVNEGQQRPSHQHNHKKKPLIMVGEHSSESKSSSICSSDLVAEAPGIFTSQLVGQEKFIKKVESP